MPPNLPFDDKNILIIDDNRAPRKMLRKLLSDFGNCNLHEEENIKGAKTLLENKTFHLIMCDHHLQDENSLNLIKWLKQQETNANKNVPIVIISSDIDKDLILEGRKLGVSNFLVKPFNMNDLSRILISTFNWPDHIRKRFE